MYQFANVNAWIFDLDHTLYGTHHKLFEQIDKKMTAFIQNALCVDRAEAFRLQKEYLKDYGTTLSGLMNRHNTSPDAFLAFVHDIDVSVLAPDPELTAAIHSLPGEKFIFTNGTVAHAERVCSQLGVWHLFSNIFDIVAGDYTPKPNAAAYPAMLGHFGIEPKRAAFFEDMARNLAPAHRLGITTVLVNEAAQSENASFEPAATNGLADKSMDGSADDAFIDHVTSDLTGFLRIIAHSHTQAR